MNNFEKLYIISGFMLLVMFAIMSVIIVAFGVTKDTTPILDYGVITMIILVITNIVGIGCSLATDSIVRRRKRR